MYMLCINFAMGKLVYIIIINQEIYNQKNGLNNKCCLLRKFTLQTEVQISTCTILKSPGFSPLRRAQG